MKVYMTIGYADYECRDMDGVFTDRAEAARFVLDRLYDHWNWDENDYTRDEFVNKMTDYIMSKEDECFYLWSGYEKIFTEALGKWTVDRHECRWAALRAVDMDIKHQPEYVYVLTNDDPDEMIGDVDKTSYANEDDALAEVRRHFLEYKAEHPKSEFHWGCGKCDDVRGWYDTKTCFGYRLTKTRLVGHKEAKA